MISIGITGHSGFIGSYLFNVLGLSPEKYRRVSFQRGFFDDDTLLDGFVAQCDVIVHLAGMNRHADPQKIFDTNIELTGKLVRSLERTKSTAHVIFSSSTQEEMDNLYGHSKKEAREMLAHWAGNSAGSFTGMIIPNIFGPFGVPFYNSVVATFCHQLTHNEDPQINVDGRIKLLYVGELCTEVLAVIDHKRISDAYIVPHTSVKNVSEILVLLKMFKSDYLENGIIPFLNDSFELNLFNTFRSYIYPQRRYPVKYTKKTDDRGSFVEVIRLNGGGQVSFSTTLPGVLRGNHFHTRKIERFAVIKGNALIQLRRVGTDEVMSFSLSGDEPSYVDMPIWYVHNIRNTGKDELYTIFWINEFYDSGDPDTYFEAV